MIDANRVYNANRTDEELLEFWLFCLFVRGKNADVQAGKLAQFVERIVPKYSKRDFGMFGDTIFAALRAMTLDDMIFELKAVGSGQYNTLSRAIYDTIAWMGRDPGRLRTMSVEALEGLHGVGPKTARYFLMNTRPKQRFAALDTHILKFLKAREGIPVPKTTPTGAKYRELEEAFLLLADYEDVNPVDLDIAVWKASREDNDPLAWRRHMEDA